MHKTIYIDTDEEIIGIISKIKKEDADEIFLVVPKNSLLTQGIINLKLLKKEVVKMSKKIILVTSDEHSRRIIKRVGLETKNKSIQDFVNNEDLNSPIKNELKTNKPSESMPIQNPRKRNIGSSNFYNSNPEISHEEKLSQTINGIASSMNSENKKIKVTTPNTFGNEHIENYNIKKEDRDETVEDDEKPKFRLNASFDKKTNANPKNTIDDFYKGDIVSMESSSLMKKSDKKENLKRPSGKKIKKISFFIIFLVFLSLLGYWSFSNWPQMKVELFLKEEILDTNLDLIVCGEKTSSDNCFDGEYQELIISVSDQYDSSGEEFSNDKGMARGIVKIHNNYSSSDQPLIATTRVLSKEGKLFRLVRSVTIPGMIDDKPGVAEVQIIADEIGQSYNIEASEFTIEGFKGNEKYEKFKVVSENPMTGGANDIENKKVKTVTEKDIDLAREKTIELFNKNLEENIKKELGESKTFALTSIKKEIISSDSSYAPGDIIDKFNYTVREKINLITFNKDEFESTIINSFNNEDLKNLELDKISNITFEKDITNHEAKTLDLSITASAVYWPILNESQLKEELSNKNNAEIKTFLTSLAKIKKAIIFYSPSWLSILPVKNENITIKISR